MTASLWLLTSVAGGLGACARYLVDRRVRAAQERALARAGRRDAGQSSGGLPAGPGARAACEGLRPCWLRLPWGTVVVNLGACLLLGVLASWTAAGSGRSGVWSVLGTGLLGGYSTFSTACLEGARLVLARSWGPHLLHALLLTLGTLTAAWAGLLLGTACC